MNTFDQLLALKQASGAVFQTEAARMILCPDLGGWIFAEVNGMSLHRLDLANIAEPCRPFNNYGGLNLWPTPEGGRFGFNQKLGGIVK